MVLLGVDPHKDTHTVVAVDQAGRQLDQTTVAARTLGHAQLLGWARHRWPKDRVSVPITSPSTVRSDLRKQWSAQRSALDCIRMRPLVQVQPGPLHPV
jgi:transposase